MKHKVSFTFIILALTMVAGIASVQPVEALLAKHECSFCHDFHGAISNNGLLKNSSVEVLCLSCHSTIQGTDTDAANVHNPLGLNSDQPGYITCRECHDPHDNRGGNVKMVGYKKDSQNWDETFTAPAIRKELPSTVGLTYNVVTFTGPTDFNIAGSAMGACEVCHPGNHQEGNDCTSCHSHSGQFIPSSGGDCRACHDGSGAAGTAKAVSVSSPHSTNTLFNSVTISFTCENCHTDHTNGNVMIPNYNAVGINYGTGGISLGAAAGGYNAVGLTEAEICWNCHTTYGVSEWGVNTDTNGAGISNYDFGSLAGGAGTPWVDSSGSTGATWSSGEAAFSYKTGPIMSTHSVNHYNSITTPGLNTRADIRCSYCHDVHELNALPNDSSSGAPYLRGTWKGSPYKEDGAPLSGMTYASQGNFGAVPRGGTGATETGGYHIDQNTANDPATLGWTANDSSGLCALCHSSSIDDGANRGLWDAGAIDSLNKFNFDESGAAETPTDSWVGDGTDDNGHSNVALGGSGSKKANIFREDWRKPNEGWCDPASSSNGYCAAKPNMANQQLTGNVRAYSFRAMPVDGVGFLVEPTTENPGGGKEPQSFQNYDWAATVDTATTDTQYHQFSCSKCHSPHASKLPRLLITNCLDVRHNTWDDSPATMLAGDTVEIAGVVTGAGKNDCTADVNGTHAVDYLDLSATSIYLSSTFTNGCSGQSIDLTWNGTTYPITSVAFDEGPPSVITFASAADIANFVGRQIPSAGSVNSQGGATVGADNDGVQLALATSAQNCHRYYDANEDGDTEDAGDQKGWNTVSPW